MAANARAMRGPAAQVAVRSADRGERAERWRTFLAAHAVAIAVAAVVAAGVTAWITATSDFLAHPGWLAVQKADFIVGPVLVGLYWLRRRPESRFGLILIGFGAVGVLYVLQSSGNPWVFGAGLMWENIVGLAAYVLILTFPTGRLDSLAARLIILGNFLAAVLPAVAINLMLPQIGAGGSISGCRELCPENALAVTSNPTLALQIWDAFRYAVIVIAAATAALLVWRFVKGTPPQRRALVIGAPVAFVFLCLVVTFHLLALVAPEATEVRTVVAWALAGARAALWYGFLAALISAQLFAARALERLVKDSLRRPSTRELEGMLRAALGDPRLRLVFRDPATDTWVASDGDRSPHPPSAEPGLGVTLVDNRGEHDVAIVHDTQLDDDPELVRTAGAIALLAAENAELEADWQRTVEELRESRGRLVRAADSERRKIERNLHDGVQQRLVATAIYVGLASDVAADYPQVRASLEEIGVSVDEALFELRAISHGIHPPILTELGIVAALRRLRLGETAALAIHATDVGRHPPEIESAVYYCCSEAIQNAVKHAGASPQISVELAQHADRLEFSISDDGAGFDVSKPHGGLGLESMRDRIGALGGLLSIVTGPGEGTVVSGSLALAAAERTQPTRSSPAPAEGSGSGSRVIR